MSSYLQTLPLVKNELGEFFSKQTVFNRKTTNYRAWKEQAIVCELLKNYDATVQPNGKTAASDERKLMMRSRNLTVINGVPTSIPDSCCLLIADHSHALDCDTSLLK